MKTGDAKADCDKGFSRWNSCQGLKPYQTQELRELMKHLMALVTIWQHSLSISSSLPWELWLPQGSTGHGMVLILPRDRDGSVCCASTGIPPSFTTGHRNNMHPLFTRISLLGPGLHPDALQAEEGAEACPCLLLVTEKRCWSVSMVAMGIGWQVLGTRVSNSLETASLHAATASFKRLLKKQHSYRAPAPCLVFDMTQLICCWSHCFLPVHCQTLQHTGYLLLTQCCFSVSPRT